MRPLVAIETQVLLAESVGRFLSEAAPVSHLRSLRDAGAKSFSSSLWSQFAELGFSGVLVPETYGGLGLGYSEAGIIMEALGHTLTPSPFLSTSVLSAAALTFAGSSQQREKWLPKIASGQAIGAFAVEESAKHCPEWTALRAAPMATGFLLNGRKTCVLDAHVANFVIVVARTTGAPGDERGLSQFLVELPLAGLAIEPVHLVDHRHVAHLTFEGTEIPREALLGQVSGGVDLLRRILDVGRATVAAELSGIAAEVATRTGSYLRERRQFGRLIGENQALQHRLAHLHTELELTSSIVLGALRALDESAANTELVVAAAKSKAGAVATLAVQEAVQLHGGIGMTDELDIGFFMKRARVAQELFGDSTYHADRLAVLHGY
jgi:alkylation response protein AidB-like acyl-CoA dehydrogenase